MKKIILPLLSLLLLASNVDARFWTNQSGRTFEGDFVEIDDNAVTIRRKSDRRKFTMPIKDLSQADQDYIKKLQEKDDGLPHNQGELMNWIVGTVWEIKPYVGDTLRCFGKNSVVYVYDRSKKNTLSKKGKYTVLSKNSLVYGPFRNKITFDDEFSSFTGINEYGKTVTGKFKKRIKL